MELNSNSPRSTSVEENWLFFHDNFLKVINDSVPVKVISKRTHLAWMNTPLKCLIRKNRGSIIEQNFFLVNQTGLNIKVAIQKQVSHSLKQQYKDYLNNMLSSKDKKPSVMYGTS